MTNDIIFIGEVSDEWRSLKERFPTAKRATDFFKAQKMSMTKMFWAVWDNVEVNYDFDFSYQPDEWSTDYVHVFKNGGHYDGIVLCGKRVKVSANEVEYRFFTHKKEINIEASVPKCYDLFYVSSYAEYCAAFSTSKSEMFWVVPPNVDLLDDFDFSFKVPKSESKHVHVFKNGDYYDGVFLCNTERRISKNEFDYSTFINKKEINIRASTPKPYDVFYISNYQDYCKAYGASTTPMFWAVWDSVDLAHDFDFSYQVPKWEEKYVHVFKNGEHFDGICLFSSSLLVNKTEVDYRFFTHKKTVDILASTTKPYDIFYVNNYEEYCTAFKHSKTNMFWVVQSDVDLITGFDFAYRVPKWEERHVHVFRNGYYIDGVGLFSKDRLVSKNEFAYSAFMNKKEVDELVSNPRPYDVVFISYNEIDAEKNYAAVLAKVPAIKRVHGVKGIHQAHVEAAKQCSTDMFWVVDGDAEIVDGFNFNFQVPKWEHDCVHVWRSQNPINDLEYGYGGVKLLPRKMTQQVDVTSADMTTSISHKFKAVPRVSNITRFDTDAFSTWRSAFRECTKLASSVIRGQVDEETEQRLNTWCNSGADKALGTYAINGARAGREYGTVHKSSDELGKINDYDWLYQKFLELTDES